MCSAVGIRCICCDGEPHFRFSILLLHVLFTDPPVGSGERAGVSGEFFGNFCGGGEFKLGEEELAEGVKVDEGTAGVGIDLMFS